MKKRNLITAIVMCATMLMSTMPVLADTHAGDGTANIEVQAVVESSYTVSLNASQELVQITDNASSKQGSYSGTISAFVQGILAEDKRVEIIVTDASFVLTNDDNGDTATATVTNSGINYYYANDNVLQNVVSNPADAAVINTYTDSVTMVPFADVEVYFPSVGTYTGSVAVEFELQSF